MSYARFGADGSDIYVYTSDRAIECCMCVLLAVLPGDNDPTFTSNAEMIEHLDAHRAAGHTVPEYTFERLRDPADAAANEAIWRKGRSA